nr:PREDICTED: uncharacterized protein LOC108952572 [Musa acuminata subsp. malaccensis]
MGSLIIESCSNHSCGQISSHEETNERFCQRMNVSLHLALGNCFSLSSKNHFEAFNLILFLDHAVSDGAKQVQQPDGHIQLHFHHFLLFWIQEDMVAARQAKKLLDAPLLFHSEHEGMISQRHASGSGHGKAELMPQGNQPYLRYSITWSRWEANGILPAQLNLICEAWYLDLIWILKSVSWFPSLVDHCTNLTYMGVIYWILKSVS